ncbi:MAG: hypothetical protein IKG08_08910 [Eubacterium sp.]|nr:hypothetical protein [Eubacterium sp.]
MRKNHVFLPVLILLVTVSFAGFCFCGCASEENGKKEASLPYFREDRDAVYTYLDKARMAVKETFDEDGFPCSRTEYGLDEEGRIIYEHSWLFDREGCVTEEVIEDYLWAGEGCRYFFSRSSCANTSW